MSKLNQKKDNANLVLLVAILLISIPQSNAATFDVGASICAPFWFCTGWSEGDCGTRTCMDSNSCGTNFGKPSEFLECDQGGGGGSGGSSSSGTGGIWTSLPDGYFTLNYDNIRVSVHQDQITQKIIIVNSSTPQDYVLEIIYPSSYTKGTEFLTTTSANKRIDGIGDFNIIIDTRNIVIGTYVIPIKVSNGKYTKEISISIDVLPEKNAITDVLIDSKLKTLGVDKEFQVLIETKGNDIVLGDKITYSIIDPKGNTILVFESEIYDPKEIKDAIKMPLDITEGYYTLNVRISSESGEYTKSTQFTVLEPEKYYPVMQQPRSFDLINWIIGGLVIVLLIAVVIRNTILSKSIEARRFRSELRWRKENMKTKFIDLRIKEKIDRMAKIFMKKDKTDVNKKAELLKQSYEKGYISLKEYNNALDSEGYHVGQYAGTASKAIAKELKEEEKMKAELAAEKKKEIEELKKAEKKLKEQVLEHEKEKKYEEKEKAWEEKQERKAEGKEEKKEKEPKEEKFEEKPLLKYEVPKDSILDKTTTAHAFVTQDGVKLHSVRDLLLALDAMPDWVFHHHTGQGRNDFATWVGDVFRYLDVAEDIKRARSKEEMIKALKAYN
ncbi:MAG TPA: hypothetical protein VEC16_07140 [Alphaproteobacteria bacterium]|nr:hypothetical protein [Alphaproteobacteria bacterium]